MLVSIVRRLHNTQTQWHGYRRGLLHLIPVNGAHIPPLELPLLPTLLFYAFEVYISRDKSRTSMYRSGRSRTVFDRILPWRPLLQAL